MRTKSFNRVRILNENSAHYLKDPIVILLKHRGVF